jgi:hypothetical protein
MKALITVTIAMAVATGCSSTTEPRVDPQLEALRASGEYNSCMPTVLRNGEQGYRCEPKTGRGEVLIKKDRGYES